MELLMRDNLLNILTVPGTYLQFLVIFFLGDFTKKNYIFREIKIFVKLISQKKIIVLPKIKNGDQDMATQYYSYIQYSYFKNRYFFLLDRESISSPYSVFFLSKSLGFFSFLGYLLVKSFGNDVGYTPGTLKQFCHK